MTYEPYPEGAANEIYNLLFCDDPEGFSPGPGETPNEWRATLYGQPLDLKAVETLASNRGVEGRVRALAYNLLRREGRPVPPKQLLGIVVEVHLEDGLDVLAAFSDGGVRYINWSGKLVFLEGVPAIVALVASLLAASQTIVDRIGPWIKPRMPPPKEGNVRLTFLVSDGLYFGEGPMADMQRDPLAGPVIARAIELLQLVVGTATQDSGTGNN